METFRTGMVNTDQLKKNLFSWNYQLCMPYIRQLGWLAIGSHLLFYFFLHYHPNDFINLLGRLVVVAAYAPLVVYPNKNWTARHKIYFELMMAATMPGYFAFMSLTHDSIYWRETFIIIVIYYGVFVRWQFMIFLYPLSIVGAFALTHLLYPEMAISSSNILELQGIVVLALTLDQVLKTFVNTVHTEIIRLKEKSDQQNEIFSALLDIGVEVSRFDDLDEIFHLLLRRFETIFPGRGFGLLVEGPRPKIIPYMAFRGVTQEDTGFLLQVHPYVLGFASVNFENGEETLASTEGENWQVFGGGIRASSVRGQEVYCFKLFIKGRLLDEGERRTLEVFLETIRGMTRSRIQSLELERYANTDHITGLFNRNYFDQVLGKWQEKARPEKPFSVIFADINGLKRINDVYGHPAGDMMIRSAGNLLSQAARGSDMIFRLGGDEFVILCPSTALEQANELVARIREGMKPLRVACVAEVSGEVAEEKVHISLGVASSLEKGPEEVVNLADKRMFEDKNDYYAKEPDKRYR